MTRCTTECGFYQSKDKHWREEQGNRFVGICLMHRRKVSDYFCGCQVTAAGQIEFFNFEGDSWEIYKSIDN